MASAKSLSKMGQASWVNIYGADVDRLFHGGVMSVTCAPSVGLALLAGWGLPQFFLSFMRVPLSLAARDWCLSRGVIRRHPNSRQLNHRLNYE
jgi:hypothetical protein